MQTRLAPEFEHTPHGREAEAILRRCVHCGFCNATCPTYLLTGDELDGPRGRIYQIKQLLEGAPVGPATQLHLDRCLTCRACETTCPSGVQYGRLADIGRALLQRRVPRAWPARLLRRLLLLVLPRPRVFALALAAGRVLRPLLPALLRRRIPVRQVQPPWPAARHARRVLVPAGCVQQSLAPQTDAALARLLDRHGISALRAESGCCGALEQHLAEPTNAQQRARANIDAWWPQVAAGVEAIVETSSACGVMVRDYAHLLQHDTAYAEKAARVAALCRDPAELLEPLPLAAVGGGRRVAYHAPCSAQHGLQLGDRVGRLLTRAGYTLLPVEESGLCCGAAGTYALQQPALSGRLLQRKLEHLQQPQPELIATANIGCLVHLHSASRVPVVHWLTLLDDPQAIKSGLAAA